MGAHIFYGTCLTVSFLLLTPPILPAEPHTVYMADPALGAIYGQSSDDIGGTPRLVSGAISFLFNSYRQLTDTQGLVVPLGNQLVALYDLETGTIVSAYEPPEGYLVHLIDAGPGENECSIMIGKTSYPNHSILLKGSRTSPADPFLFTEGPWNHENCFYPDAMMHLGGEKYVIQTWTGSTECPPNGLLLVDEASTNTIILDNPPLAPPAFVRGPDGSFLVMHGNTNVQKVTLYNYGGAILEQQAAPFPEDNISSMGHYSGVWSDGEPPFASITREGLVAGSLPSNSTPIKPEMLFRFRDDFDLFKVEENLSGPGTLHQTSAIDFIIASESHGRVHKLNVEEGNLEQQFVYTRGSGPAFEDIAGLVTGADGTLYVLDEHISTVRIVRVLPLCGTRTVVHERSREHYLPFLMAAPDGDLIMLEGSSSGTSFIRVLSLNPETGTVQQLAEGAANALVPRIATLLDGKEVKIRYSGFSNTVWKTSGGSFEKLDREVGAEQFAYFQEYPSGNMIWQGGFEITPEDASYDYVVFDLVDGDGSSYSFYPISFKLTSPGGVEHDVAHWQKAPPSAGSSLKVVRATIPIGGTSLETGSWHVEASLSSDAFYAMPSPSPVVRVGSALNAQYELTGDQGSSLIFTFNPSSLLRVNQLTDAIVDRLFIEGFPSVLIGNATMSDGVAYMAPIDNYAVWRVDTTTGEAVLFSDKRPDAVDGKLLGASARTPVYVTVGEVLDASAVPGRWVFY